MGPGAQTSSPSLELELGLQAPLSVLLIPTSFSQLGPPSAQVLHDSNVLPLPAPIALITCSWKMVKTEAPLALLSGGASLQPGRGQQWGGGRALSLQAFSQGWVPSGVSQERGHVGCQGLHILRGQQGP